MSIDLEDTWGQFFKSEVKTSGRKLFAEEKLSLSSGSDTFIQAYARATPPCKVTLASDDIGSETFTAACTCPVGKKGHFCKHVWATLLAVQERYPDFLSEKKTIEAPENQESSGLAARREKSDSQKAYESSAKLRAAEYRKEQYQKQKQKAKELKQKRGGGAPSKLSLRALPAEVEGALEYFDKNGFPMPGGPDEAIVGEAKRTLSGVFHPDKGGSHEETVELNRQCDLLLRFLRG